MFSASVILLLKKPPRQTPLFIRAGRKARVLRARAVLELPKRRSKPDSSPKSVNTRIDLYSATGALMPGKPYKPAKVLKLIKASRAQWITEGVSAQLLYWSDAELEEDNRRIANRKIQDASDKETHKGQWQVIHADLNYENPEAPLTSGWQLPHPRLSEPPVLSPVMGGSV